MALGHLVRPFAWTMLLDTSRSCRMRPPFLDWVSEVTRSQPNNKGNGCPEETEVDSLGCGTRAAGTPSDRQKPSGHRRCRLLVSPLVPSKHPVVPGWRAVGWAEHSWLAGRVKARSIQTQEVLKWPVIGRVLAAIDNSDQWVSPSAWVHTHTMPNGQARGVP